MGYTPSCQEAIQHLLFGGATSGVVNHNVFRLYLSKLDDTYHCNFEVLEQEQICGSISSVVDGPWIKELASHSVKLSDTGEATDIEILVGADIAAKLWTGRRIPLSSGLVAMETSLGWTLSGKIPGAEEKGPPVDCNLIVTVVTSMLNAEVAVTDLQDHDVLVSDEPLETTPAMKEFPDRLLQLGRWEPCSNMVGASPRSFQNLEEVSCTMKWIDLRKHSGCGHSRRHLNPLSSVCARRRWEVPKTQVKMIESQGPCDVKPLQPVGATTEAEETFFAEDQLPVLMKRRRKGRFKSQKLNFQVNYREEVNSVRYL